MQLFQEREKGKRNNILIEKQIAVAFI